MHFMMRAKALVEEGVIDIEDREFFWFAETADDIWEHLLCWYERNGQSLIGETLAMKN